MNRTVILVFTCCLLSGVLSNQALGQDRQDRLKRFLKQIDTDQNGRIDKAEMTPQVKQFFEARGFDTAQSIKIKSVLKKKPVESNTQSKAERKSKVPSFGVDRDDSDQNVRSFGGGEVVNYSDRVIEKADDVMRRYDRNKDGYLDREESRRARWGNPPPTESDKNGDGNLSLNEIRGRYHAREVAEQQSEKRDPRANEQRSSRSDRRESDSSNSRRSSTRSSSSNSSRPQSAEASRREQLTKVTEYAKSYFEKYDDNENGYLDKDELKEIRRPPTAADFNKDGRVSKTEFIDFRMPKTSSQSTRNDSSSSRSSSSRNDRNRSRSDRSRSRSRSDFSDSSRNGFGGKDKNNDNILQMHEYAELWTQKTLDSFNAKDANGDGLLTPDEW